MKTLFIALFIVSTCFSYANDIDDRIAAEKEQAIRYIDSVGVMAKSPHWPSIDPVYFSQNIKQNIEYPVLFFGGRNTNFCGYSALTYSCLIREPMRYAQFMVDLYKNGKASYRQVKFTPSARIRTAPGEMMYKGQLDINHADQLWFLVLADHFKGYLNWINMKYDPGDENTLWASTTLGKFNRMMRKMFEYDIHSRGTDLIRPSIRHLVPYLIEKMNKGEVFLYLNNTILYRKKHKVKTMYPTHYVVLDNICEDNGIVTLTYWDYGLKTLQKLPMRVVKKILYAVIWHEEIKPL